MLGGSNERSGLSAHGVDLLGKARLDFRWEVYTPPTEAMWVAMREASADLGMASFGQDRTVLQLNDRVAELTGHEAAMFLPSTTTCITLAWQAMDLAGKQAIMEERCHHYWVEHLHVCATTGAAPVLVRGDKFGCMSLEAVEAALTRSYYAGPIETALISIENTHNLCGGTYLTPAYTRQVADLAHRHGAALFVDGARIFNAAVAQDVPVRELTSPADAVAFSLGKGLSAPLGAMLCGSAELLRKVEPFARRAGALAMHRAGMFAAAGLVALDEMLPRLAGDHARARRLADLLVDVDGLALDLETVQTNFVRLEVRAPGLGARRMGDELLREGLAVHVVEPRAFKLVTNYTTTDAEVEEAASIIRRVAGELTTSAS